MCANTPQHVCDTGQTVVQAGGASAGVVSHNAHLHITYSAGLQALQLGKYSTALRCFQVSPGLPPSPPPPLPPPLRTHALCRCIPPFCPSVLVQVLWEECFVVELAWFMLNGIICWFILSAVCPSVCVSVRPSIAPSPEVLF